MRQWTDEQREHLTAARELAKGMRNDLLDMATPDDILPLDKFLMAIIFDQAVENINNKLFQS